MHILQTINGHEDLVKLTDKEREQLCQEIREFLISKVSKTGGHLASNLGVVELSVAIETVFDTAHDRLVFDVGHQSYVHKLLTGRQADFDHLRQFGGMSGYPKPSESDSDAFVAGHASSSVSIALGMARARSLQKQDYHVVTLLGDGAATGGMVYEGLNDAAMSKEPMVIILNDNEMSIDRNVGGLARHLSRLRSSDDYLKMKYCYRKVLEKLPGGRWFYNFSSKVKNRLKRLLLPSTIFENMGLTYLGPVDGHDLPDLIDLLRAARDLNSPVLVHVLTRKGYGYQPAVQNPSRFHGIGKFDPETGVSLGSSSGMSFSDAFGATMVELGRENNKVCAITAAMPGGTGLLDFRKEFPDRLFDVGIAEEHAVSMAGGLAKQGMVPVVALYSTFLQRSFDQIMQDVGLLGLHVVFAIDRAGLVGEDGSTHHGTFDVGFLRQVPGMMILCPSDLTQLRRMLRWAVNDYNGPVAVRYPRGTGKNVEMAENGAFDPSCVEVCKEGCDAALITYGTLTWEIMQAAEILKKDGMDVSVLRLNSVTHFNEETLKRLTADKPVFVVEEACAASGVKEHISWVLRQNRENFRIYGIDLGSDFVIHGDMKNLYKHTGLDSESVANYVREVLRHED